MSDSITDKRTLADIWSDDAAMTDDAIKNASRHKFDDPQKATAFSAHCIDVTLKKCGIKISKGMKPKMAQMLMKRHRVVIESRNNHSKEDEWKDGVYITKDGTLEAFISYVHRFLPGQFTKDRSPYFAVITNAKV